MNTAGPLYEGDGHIHSWLPGNPVAGATVKPVGVLTLIERFFNWLDEKARAAHRREIEKYLAQSTDVCDLERRMRDLERRGALFG